MKEKSSSAVAIIGGADVETQMASIVGTILIFVGTFILRKFRKK